MLQGPFDAKNKWQVHFLELRKCVSDETGRFPGRGSPSWGVCTAPPRPRGPAAKLGAGRLAPAQPHAWLLVFLYGLQTVSERTHLRKYSIRN